MTSTAITIIIILVEFGRADGSLMDVAENVNIAFNSIQFNSFQFENAQGKRLFLVPSCIISMRRKIQQVLQMKGGHPYFPMFYGANCLTFWESHQRTL